MTAMFNNLTANSPSLGDPSNYVFYASIKDYLLGNDGQITRWTTDMAVRMGELMGMIALPVFTVWLMLLGYRILTGQSREPMMASVIQSARAMLIIFISTSVGLGNPWIAAKIGELSDLVSVLITGSKNMGSQIEESLGWMQAAFSSIDALPSGDDAAVAAAKDRALWFTGIGTATPSIVCGTMLILYEIVITFLIAMGPLAAMCLLFERTKALFQHWLQYCISSLFRLATTAVMVSISMKMVVAVAAAFWADKLANAAVLHLSGGVVDLHMDEGISSMAMQQGGLGLILTVLIIYVPQMVAQFFMGALGQFMHYSSFGAPGGTNNQPGPRGEPAGSYQQTIRSENRMQDRQTPDTSAHIHNQSVGRQSTPTGENRDVIKSIADTKHNYDKPPNNFR